MAGPAVILSYVVAGISALLSAFCYTEFAIQVAGSCCLAGEGEGEGGCVAGWMAGWLAYGTDADADLSPVFLHTHAHTCSPPSPPFFSPQHTHIPPRCGAHTHTLA